MKQNKKRIRNEFEKMRQRVDIMGCVAIGFLILTSIACVGIVVGGAVFLCD